MWTHCRLKRKKHVMDKWFNLFHLQRVFESALLTGSEFLRYLLLSTFDVLLNGFFHDLEQGNDTYRLSNNAFLFKSRLILCNYMRACVISESTTERSRLLTWWGNNKPRLILIDIWHVSLIELSAYMCVLRRRRKHS